MINLTALAGTLIGGLIATGLATWIAKLNARMAAGSRLRAAFAPELAIMRATPSNERTPLKDILNEPGRIPEQDVTEFLLSAFKARHAAAVEEYRFYVPAKRRVAYEEAWKAYYFTGGSINFTAYMVGQESHQLFCRKVESIFNFTKLSWRDGGWLPTFIYNFLVRT